MKKFIYCYLSNPFSTIQIKEKSFYKIRRAVPSISESITIKTQENIYSIQFNNIHIRDHNDLEYYLRCPCMNIIDWYRIVRRLLILKKYEEIHLS